MNRSILFHLVSRCAPFAVAVVLPASACKGPEPEQRAVALNIPDQGSVAVQWNDGARRPNAELELQKAAEGYADQLFQGEPMPRELPRETGAASQPVAEPVAVDDGGEDTKPGWADGVQKPPEVAENDMPRAWPIEVHLGETPALLAEWSGSDGKQIVADNEEMLGRRKWLKTGDRISVTMTPNQKIAFDRARDAFQKQRVDAFFARRYFEKVIVYRVKRGEYISAAAKRYGDVPLWLIEEFNQTDFRGLQPGDEILIPVVSTLAPGQASPPPLAVVDEDMHPIADTAKSAVDARLKGDFMARARLALDDSNVFMRAHGGDVAAMEPQPVGQAAYGQAPAQPESPSMAAGAERQLPAASIGSHDLLPNYQMPGQMPGQVPGQVPGQMPGQVQAGAQPVAGYPQPQAPSAQAVAVPSGAVNLRDVVVKRGESLLHYVKWSKSTLDAVKTANPHLDPERIFVGMRVAIPMDDAQYVAFMKARSSWEKDGDEKPADKPSDKANAKPKKHTVKAGDTGTSIARQYKVSVKALKAANPKLNLKKLKAGTKVAIPGA